MTVNLIKLCVGVSDVTQLVQEHERLVKQSLKRKIKKPVEDHQWTRMRPKRDEEVLDGGSLFWVIRGTIRVRHRILRLDDVTDADGQAYCAIIYDPKVILVEPRPRRAFQGFRSPAGEELILANNMFVERVLPGSILRQLSEAEMAHYRRPFANRGEDRRATLSWPAPST